MGHICEMIDRGWLKVIITTGALVAHGLIETLGRVHYKCPADRGDRELYQQGYNRIYDTLEMEANLDYAEEVFREVLEGLDKDQVWCSSSLCRELGRIWLAQTSPGFCGCFHKACRCLSGVHRSELGWIWPFR
jgi:deoxyhypusine synthase